MSTKKLREALWDMEHNGSGPQPELAREARTELEALNKYGEDVRPYRERLLALFRDADQAGGEEAAACAGAMKDALIELGMEWSAEKGDYVFP